MAINIWLSFYNCPKISTNPFYYLSMCLNTAGWVEESADPDQIQHAASLSVLLHSVITGFLGFLFYSFSLIKPTKNLSQN